jgi:hypothetical protein
MKKNKEQEFQVTSDEQPEDKVYSGWGSSIECGLQPFHLWTRRSETTKPFYRCNGVEHEKLIAESHQGMLRGDQSQHFFYPNHPLTYLDGRRRPYKVVDALIGTPMEQAKTRNLVSWLNFLFADIDCYENGMTEEQYIARRAQAYDQIQDLPVQPDVIVDSGYGFHIYYAIEPISLLDGLDANQSPHSIWMIERYKRIQLHLAGLLGGDPSTTALFKAMRVPGTWNLKVLAV